MKNKYVSIIVPCRNEVNFIQDFCKNTLNQELPDGWNLELIIADGLSDDGTFEFLEKLSSENKQIILIKNEGKIVSTGLNACIKKSRGEIIVRMDVHTHFAPDYVLNCIKTLEMQDADNVGGAWVARGITSTGKSIAAAFQSRWIMGGALSRDEKYNGYADTVYLGCWRRKIFDNGLLFNEKLVRNQDDEHNLRLRKAGFKIWQSSDIKSFYYPRQTFSKLFAQQRQYGYWRSFVIGSHGQAGAIRQFIPAIFVLAIIFGVLLIPISPAPLFLLFLIYSLYLIFVSIKAGIDSNLDLASFIKMPVTVFIYHFAYGFGTICGAFDYFLKRKAGDKNNNLTR